jgi:hypothetical protein
LKALANMFSSYYDSSRFESLHENDEHEVALFEQLIDVALQGCVDKNSKTRHMAVFALGNLSMALYPNLTLTTLVRDSTLDSIASRVHLCLSDDDDKVKGNAIRSMAHVVCLMHVRGGSPLRLHTLELINETLSFLACVAQATLALRGGYDVHALTWKERQSLKKLGWGSFNALARVFDSGIARRDELSGQIEEVLLVLVECVTSLSNTSDKVFLAACSCLRSALSDGSSAVRRVRLEERKRGTLVGACILRCISILHPDRPNPTFGGAGSACSKNDTKRHNEVEILLKVLLEKCSVADARLILQHFSKTGVTQHLRWLHEWMDTHESTSLAFNSFALAISSTNESQVVDPDIEIRFSTRATSLISDQDDFEDEEM